MDQANKRKREAEAKRMKRKKEAEAKRLKRKKQKQIGEPLATIEKENIKCRKRKEKLQDKK